MASDLLQTITPFYLGPSFSTGSFKGTSNDDFFFNDCLLTLFKHDQSIITCIDQSW